LGATAAFLVSISLKAMRIIALAQAAFLGFLAISGIITINFGRLLEIITDIVSWLANSLESIFSSILELGSFGAGFAGGFIGTTVLLEALNDDA
jgi:uncharacterized membrane protein (Fun14 family)|tara:strand:- start:112 stop:393 length:282 start_codon:yes stop_codon:yes gene_type:complete